MSEQPQHLVGQLLIASPALVDPNFRRTVVLITAHTEEGAMGLVLNRPSPVGVADGVSHLEGLVQDGDAVFLGGPVETSAVVALAEFEDPAQAAALVLDDVGFLPGDGDPEELCPATKRVRIYAGYAGWGAGQLEAELQESAWIVNTPDPEDIFTPEPDELWSAVLSRMGGQYALVATMPPDPSLN